MENRPSFDLPLGQKLIVLRNVNRANEVISFGINDPGFYFNHLQGKIRQKRYGQDLFFISIYIAESKWPDEHPLFAQMYNTG